MNWLWVTIDCTSRWGPRESSYELRACACARSAVYSRFALLPMKCTFMYTLKVHLRTTTKYTCEPSTACFWALFPRVPPKELKHHLQVHLTTTCKCILKYTAVMSPSTSGVHCDAVSTGIQAKVPSAYLPSMLQDFPLPLFQSLYDDYSISYQHLIIWTRMVREVRCKSWLVAIQICMVDTTDILAEKYWGIFFFFLSGCLVLKNRALTGSLNSYIHTNNHAIKVDICAGIEYKWTRRDQTLPYNLRIGI
jgi:hypothetical protein